MFKFLIGDFKPKCWHWEIVELFRKLLLSRTLSLVGIGRIAQAVLATVISFGFFSLHLNLKSYKTATLTTTKAVTVRGSTIRGSTRVCHSYSSRKHVA